MYLLNVRDRVLEPFLGSNRPPKGYAILSHTWGMYEARFEDFPVRMPPFGEQGLSQQAHPAASEPPLLPGPGHAKIDNCCKQAKLDGFTHVWIDTCCIDKRSSAELSEAINSMFAWYEQATICYIYLDDVEPKAPGGYPLFSRCPALPAPEKKVPDNISPRGWKTPAANGYDELEAEWLWPTPGQQDRNVNTEYPGNVPLMNIIERGATQKVLTPAQRDAIKNSRWFTRGWTLQELLAPGCLAIFDASWTLVGYSINLAPWCNSLRYIRNTSEQIASWPVPCLTQLLADRLCINSKYLWNSDIRGATVATRMALVANRRTTREEDMAYCLLGIFEVNMALLYGEGQKSFRRLQEEIIKISTDQSIFAFGLSKCHEAMEATRLVKDSDVTGRSCLAATPTDFAAPEVVSLIRNPEPGAQEHYYSTNRGIFISLPMLELPSGEWLAKLNHGEACLILRPNHNQDNVYSRRHTSGIEQLPSMYFDPEQNTHIVHRNIYLSCERTESPWLYPKLRLTSAFRKTFTLRATYPTFGHLPAGHPHRITPSRTLQDGSPNPCADCDEIFLDMVDRQGLPFALHVSIHRAAPPSKGISQTDFALADFDEVSQCQSGSWWACLSVCRGRKDHSMAELMLNANPLRHGDTTAKPRFPTSDSIRWKRCTAARGYETGGNTIHLTQHPGDISSREGGIWRLQVTSSISGSTFADWDVVRSGGNKWDEEAWWRT